MGLVVDLAPYLDEKEREKYIEAYLEEGDFDGDDSIKIFPTAKCTELMFLNDTDWQKFAQAAGADYSDLSTVEGVVRTAEKYYDWTDAQTDAPDDGRRCSAATRWRTISSQARRSWAPRSSAQRTGRMTLNFDRDAVRRLWDNYYVPFIKGYFSASGRFRSDEIKSGGLLAYVGLERERDLPADAGHPGRRPELRHHDACAALPDVRGLRAGGGAAGRRHGRDSRHRRADRGFGRVPQMDHRAGKQHQLFGRLGYLPVTHAACDMDAIEQSGLPLSGSMKEILSTAIDTVNSCELYTMPAFTGAKDARSILESCMSDRASADRRTVEERLAAGQSAADAEAEFLTDGCFENWYNETLEKLRSCEG